MKNASKGMTLVELIVSLTITSFLISFLVGTLFFGTRQYRKILKRQMFISESVFFRNILENNLIALYDPEMKEGNSSFHGTSQSFFFNCLQENSKGIFPRKLTVIFNKEKDALYLFVEGKPFSETKILIKKKLMNATRFMIQYFDSHTSEWANEWQQKTFPPSLIFLEIKNNLFSEPLLFIFDIFSGKIF